MQILGRNFLPELSGEIHPGAAPLQALRCSLSYTEQSTFRGGENGENVPRKGEEEGWPAKGAKRKKGRVKTGQKNRNHRSPSSVANVPVACQTAVGGRFGSKNRKKNRNRLRLFVARKIARLSEGGLSGPVRDTPPYRAIPFRDSIAEGGIAPICLVFIGYRAGIAEIPLLRGGYRTSTSHALQGGNAQKKERGYRTQLAMLRHQKPHSAQ